MTQSALRCVYLVTGNLYVVDLGVPDPFEDSKSCLRYRYKKKGKEYWGAWQGYTKAWISYPMVTGAVGSLKNSGRPRLSAVTRLKINCPSQTQSPIKLCSTPIQVPVPALTRNKVRGWLFFSAGKSRGVNPTNRNSQNQISVCQLLWQC